jgi:type III secretory pathway component EscV
MTWSFVVAAVTLLILNIHTYTMKNHTNEDNTKKHEQQKVSPTEHTKKKHEQNNHKTDQKSPHTN